MRRMINRTSALYILHITWAHAWQLPYIIFIYVIIWTMYMHSRLHLYGSHIKLVGWPEDTYSL